MRASGTRAGTPAFPDRPAEQVGERCGSASRGWGQKPRAGWGGPSVQRSGLHFCSPASQTRPSPSGPTGPGAQPGRGRRRSAPKPPAHGRLVEACPPSISPPDTMHGQSYSSPASVTSVQGNCGPRGLALSSTVPWPGVWLLCLFQKPGPRTRSPSRGPARTQPPTAGPGRQMLPLGACPQPTCPVVLCTTQDVLACCVVG